MTDHNNISEREWLIPTTLFRYGVTRIIELRITEQLERLKTGQPVNSYFGLSDLELGAKIQILKREGINTQIAFISHIIFPTGSGGLSGNSTGIITKIAISHSLSDFLNVGYNLGYTFPGHGNGDLTYSGTTGFRISEKVGVYAEIYGEVNEFKSLIANFDSGLTFLIQNNLQLDLSAGTGLNQKMSFFSIGCSWNIYKKQSGTQTPP